MQSLLMISIVHSVVFGKHSGITGSCTTKVSSQQHDTCMSIHAYHCVLYNQCNNQSLKWIGNHWIKVELQYIKYTHRHIHVCIKNLLHKYVCIYVWCCLFYEITIDIYNTPCTHSMFMYIYVVCTIDIGKNFQ